MNTTAVMATDQATKNKEVIRDLYEHIINERRYERLAGLIADSYEAEGGGRGAEGYERTVRSVVAGFPDVQFTVNDLVAEGDKVVARWTWTGTNTGSFRGFPVSGRPVTTQGIVVYEFADGKIVRSWLQNDRVAVLVGIGVITKEQVTPPAK